MKKEHTLICNTQLHHKFLKLIKKSSLHHALKSIVKILKNYERNIFQKHEENFVICN
jgi:hypothetical protein